MNINVEFTNFQQDREDLWLWLIIIKFKENANGFQHLNDQRGGGERSVIFLIEIIYLQNH